MAKANPFRFSTKYQDDETDLVVFPARYYGNGRFLTRDLIAERGGFNIYAFTANNPINAFDPLGLDIVCNCPEAYFSSLGLQKGVNYQQTGANRFTGTAPPSDLYNNLERETVWRMLFTKRRTFTARNLDVEELKKHVASRLRVVAATDLVHWAFGFDAQSPVDYAYWAEPWVLKDSSQANRAINGVFDLTTPGTQTGCRMASMFVLLKGVSASIGSVEFNARMYAAQSGWDIERQAVESGVVKYDRLPESNERLPFDWVPGDRGYIRGSGHGPLGGEWLIDIGKTKLWGFGGEGWEEKRTLVEWFKQVADWGVPPADPGYRFYPSAGLQ